MAGIVISDYVDEQFIRSRVRVSAAGCWEWIKAVSSSGYGHFNIPINGKQKTIKAHRAAYELFRGESPVDNEVMHRCDNTLCCNPDHLRLGDHQANMTDMKRKGRAVGHPGASNPKSVLTNEDVEVIRATPTGHGVIKKLSERYGVSTTHIHRVRSGECWPREVCHR